MAKFVVQVFALVGKSIAPTANAAVQRLGAGDRFLVDASTANEALTLAKAQLPPTGQVYLTAESADEHGTLPE